MQWLRGLRQYATDLNSIPRLSREETRQLISCLAAARQGALSPEQAAQAKRRLIEGHLWLAVALVKRSGARLRLLSPLDLVQQGNLGLLRACDRFDFASGGNFTAYASTTIHYAILDALPMENTIRLSQHMTWRNRTDERVEALLSQLTLREQQVLRLHYGLDEDDGRCHSPTTIARQLGLDCSTVCNLEQHALQKLRTLADPQTEQACHPRTCRRPASPHSPQEQAERRREQQQRLEAACATLEAQGIPICVRSLARAAHVDKKVIQPFLRAYWEQQGSEQERLEAAYAELEAEGVPVTTARLCGRAHVGSRAAAAFLKNYHPVVRPKQRPASKVKPTSPAKASPQERLSEAYTRLVAQGERVTRARLRQEARASTDAARSFLRAQRTSETNSDPS